MMDELVKVGSGELAKMDWGRVDLAIEKAKTAKDIETLLGVDKMLSALDAYCQGDASLKREHIEVIQRRLSSHHAKGGILEAAPKGRGGRPGKNMHNNCASFQKILDSHGVHKNTALLWRDLWKWERAAPKDYEKLMEALKVADAKLTIMPFYRAARLALRPPKETPPLPTGKFAVVYADPPWKYDNSGFDEAAEFQYPTMDVSELCSLNIKEITTNNTILFMWATNPLLPGALDVLIAWGFQYKTNMAWIKDRGRGKGWFLKSKHELLLIGTKKETPHPENRPDSCFEAGRGTKHSRKPDKAYNIIESMYPGPLDETYYVELFAREGRQGWASWGNEIDGSNRKT